ncbi:MAG: PepSY-associated TM helix domain-containing protein [Kangiellaceae bacterium]|jgi:hypothetical protein|nr:PepSY-associated TM helix domain-containing protein [Kangiellaceae bacterium]
MSRKLLIDIHLYLAAFFAPIVLMIAVSGGLYLVDSKGNTEKEVVHTGALSEFDFDNKDRKSEVEKLLQTLNIDHSFEYIRGNSSSMVTRPTSSTYYAVYKKDNQLVVEKRDPDLIATIIELHKGHGPNMFRTFQIITAIGLVITLISGLWLGLTSPVLKQKSLVLTGAGALIFILLAIL